MKCEANENTNGMNVSSSGQIVNSYENHPVPYENIKKLQERVLNLGFSEACAFAVEDPINKGISHFETKFQELRGPEMVAYSLQISRHENGFHNLDKIKATLYPFIKVDPLVINGIDIRKLETVMETMNWQFEKFRWGKEVEDSLRLISLDDDGKMIAVALWNNSAPLNTVKPDFIEQLENEVGIYISKGFSGHTNLEEIYSELKERQLIDEKLSILPIDAVHNPKTKLAMTEHLAKDKFLSMQLRTSPTERTELFFKWDSTYKEMKISDEEGNPYHVGKDKFWNKSDNRDQIKIESQKDDPLLQKHRSNNGNGIKP